MREVGSYATAYTTAPPARTDRAGGGILPREVRLRRTASRDRAFSRERHGPTRVRSRATRWQMSRGACARAATSRSEQPRNWRSDAMPPGHDEDSVLRNSLT